jgi:hypothetical protein
MRRFAAFLILIGLFILLVGTRFAPSDGDKLASVGRVALGKVRDALPPAAKMAAPFNAIRREIPERTEDKVKARLEADARLEGVTFDIAAEGNIVTLRGVMPNAKTRRTAVSIAENTKGVEKVIDELAVPEN